MAKNKRRSLATQTAVALSLLNLLIIITGILWINDAFRQAEAHDQDVKEIFKTKAGELSDVLQSLGGIAIFAALIFGLGWFFRSYKKANRESVLHRQSSELNSYLGNLSRDKKSH